ncbi:hypothetical protein DFS34DRAFT_250817 [Phlyctochytrium arcticum]|nr:hypothetical protein DFS34DRAFT_250817 [Phlyctochytrium arcticum]
MMFPSTTTLLSWPVRNPKLLGWSLGSGEPGVITSNTLEVVLFNELMPTGAVPAAKTLAPPSRWSSFCFWAPTRYHPMNGVYRNNIKIESISFAEDALDGGADGERIKNSIGHEMSVLSEMMTHGTLNDGWGTFNLWSKGSGFSQFALYDFYHQIGDIVSRDLWYNQRSSLTPANYPRAPREFLGSRSFTAFGLKLARRSTF